MQSSADVAAGVYRTPSALDGVITGAVARDVLIGISWSGSPAATIGGSGDPQRTIDGGIERSAAGNGDVGWSFNHWWGGVLDSNFLSCVGDVAANIGGGPQARNNFATATTRSDGVGVGDGDVAGIV